MNVQASVLSLAIATGLALAAAPAQAAGNLKSAAVTRANALVTGNPALVRRAQADTFVARDAVTGRNGTEHVRFARNYRGLPVIGGDFVVHSRNGKVAGISQRLGTSARPALTGRLSSDQAIVEAGVHFGTHFVGAPSARKVVYARDVAPVLAYEVVMKGIKADQTETEMHYFVDANTGRILDKWDDVQTAKPGPGGGDSCRPGARGCSRCSPKVRHLVRLVPDRSQEDAGPATSRLKSAYPCALPETSGGPDPGGGAGATADDTAGIESQMADPER